MIKYDKLFELFRANGINTTMIRKQKILGQSVLTKLRNGTGGLDYRTIDRLCCMFDCQPNDIMEYVPDEEANRT